MRPEASALTFSSQDYTGASYGESPLVELKNGETYNGHLVNCDTWMNIHLREVICTSKVYHETVEPIVPIIFQRTKATSFAYGQIDHPETFMDRRRHMYGKVFKSHLFGSPTIVSTDAEVSRFVLQSDGKAFVPSYPKSLTELMGKSSILLITRSLQRRIRGLIGSFFKSSYLKAQIPQDMHKYLQQSMKDWRDDHPIYIQDEAKNIAFQVLVKALVSMDPGDETEFLKKQFQEFMAGLISLPINIPGSRLHKSLQANGLLQAKKKMVELVHKIIEAKKKNRGRSEIAKDVADVLLNDASEELNDDLISDNMIDLMIPGEDSVPVLITLAVKYLSDCPEENLKQKRLKDELREPLCWTDYLSLPFTQTVITETLRMRNSPFCFPDPKMATVLFPSLSYTYSGEASEEFDRDDNTLTLIKPSPMPSKDIRSPLEVGSVHGGNNGVSNVDLEEDKTE
ncbi:hypothetical protein HYC85_010431 [Camellia sinensis]|uniref:Sm domain-containing protein n=1 Tax=Camellia sinensis TaxID=4442 RepID=A0A7J7HJ97_CAMSI|nr:hypothetical protein HYC85_010431 [Camellia sinensis]